jgi:AcrR family transcriptional regulator
MTKKSEMTDEAPAPSGRRAMQAEQTRRDILEAARRRFATQGYAATSLKDVAADAGVSVQTLYDSIGSKADLVRRLNDLVDVEANVGEIAATIGTEEDPRVIARIPARITRRLLERCSDILRAALTGAQAEPELASVVDEGGRRHRAGAAGVAGRLAGLGALRPGLTVDGAATTIALLADYRMALVLVDDHHLTLGEVEDWIADVTARTVLA